MDDGSGALRLTGEGGSDYVLDGNSCWLEVGNVLLYLRKNQDDSVSTVAYSNRPGELSDELASFTIRPELERTPHG